MDLRLGEIRSALRSVSQALIYRAPGECECCPACGSLRLYELDLLLLRRSRNGKRTGFISGCNDCGLVFSNPQPSLKDLKRFYSPTGEWDYHEQMTLKTLLSPPERRAAGRGAGCSSRFVTSCP